MNTRVDCHVLDQRELFDLLFQVNGEMSYVFLPGLNLASHAAARAPTTLKLAPEGVFVAQRPSVRLPLITALEDENLGSRMSLNRFIFPFTSCTLRQGRGHTPVTQQTPFDVLGLQRFTKKRIRSQIQHPGRKVVAGAPICVRHPQFFG